MFVTVCSTTALLLMIFVFELIHSARDSYGNWAGWVGLVVVLFAIRAAYRYFERPRW